MCVNWRGWVEEWTVGGFGMAALYLALEWHSGIG